MKRKKYILFVAVAVILLGIGIGIILRLDQERNKIHISTREKDKFCFEEIDFGSTEEDFVKGTGKKLEKITQDVIGRETVYIDHFRLRKIHQDVDVYYYFSKGIFQGGSYKIAFEEKDKEKVIDGVRDELYEALLTIEGGKFLNNGTEKSLFDHYWEMDLLEDNCGCFWDDDRTNKREFYGVLRIEYYIVQNNENSQHVMEIQIYEGKRKYPVWPEDLKVAYDSCKDPDGTGLVKKELSYVENRVKILQINRNKMWVADWRTREVKVYKMSDDCELWGCYDSSTWLFITPELLEEGIRSKYPGYWFIGLNEKGEAAHVYEQLLP